MVIRALNKFLLSVMIFALAFKAVYFSVEENLNLLQVIGGYKEIIVAIAFVLLLLVERDFFCKYTLAYQQLSLEKTTIFDDPKYQKGYKTISICIAVLTFYVVVSSIVEVILQLV